MTRWRGYNSGTARELRTVERWLESGHLLVATCLVLVAARFLDVVFAVTLAASIGFSLTYTWIVLDIQRRGDRGDRVHLLLGGVWFAILSWMLIGTVLFALGPLVGDIGWAAYVAGLLGVGPFVSLAILVGSCAGAVLFQGAVDSRAAIRRATLATAVAIALLFGFGVAETALTDFVFSRLALPQGSAALIAGGVMAVAFKPIHERIERRMPDWLRSE